MGEDPPNFVSAVANFFLKMDTMKKTSKIIVMLLVTLFSVTGVMAQKSRSEKMTDEQRAERMAQRMTKELSLDEKQTELIEQIYLQHFEQTKKAEQERQQRMKQMEDQINQVLTAEQREQWEKKQAEVKERMTQRRSAPGAGRPMGPGWGAGPGPDFGAGLDE